MTVQDIFDFLNREFPVDTACDFDNVGVLVGDKAQEVKKAIIALDCTMDTVKKAVDSSCELIITHHPIIFEPLKSVLKGSIVYEIIRNKLSVISMHTNLDVGKGGVNDSLCKEVFGNSGDKLLAADGYTLNKYTVSPILPELFSKLLKDKLGGSIKYSAPDKPLTEILICSGSGGNYVSEAKRLGCDALLTADIKHSQFLEAERLGIALFDAGHFNTEDIVVEPLRALLKTQFPQAEFLTTHNSTIKYA